jgi:hypothetical protein
VAVADQEVFAALVPIYCTVAKSTVIEPAVEEVKLVVPEFTYANTGVILIDTLKSYL